eukprot:474449_1
MVFAPSSKRWKTTDPSLVRQFKTAKQNSNWCSPMFSFGGLRWFLRLHPNGYSTKSKGYAMLALHLAFLPPKVKSIKIAKDLRMIETDTVCISTTTFDEDKMNWGWNLKQLQTKAIQNLTTFTFSVKIEVCGVVDHEDNDITNQYINTNDEESKHSPSQDTKQSDQKLIESRLDSLTNSVDKLVNNFQSVEQRLRHLEQVINEEQKDNSNDTMGKLTEEIHVMKQDLQKLSTLAKGNPKHLELQSWLEIKVGFPQYYEIFIENGIEDLSIASLLTMESIKR